ncbi:hydroxyproline N-acetylglucosaminyltransferase [Acrasis kona]|uniref:Hydroxyproline N-acetylglucosaminyltransferase n=1 Tax=Acrasis kona TaxID=1008807 RepID=A0AAW2ZAM6_9EUKA
MGGEAEDKPNNNWLPRTINGVPLRKIAIIAIIASTVFFVLLQISESLKGKSRTKMLSKRFVSIPKSMEGKKIFVSLASYRDINCMRTLQSLYRTAQYPDNVYVGVLQQNSDRDSDCLSVGRFDDPSAESDLKLLLKYQDHIRTVRIDATEAKGPVYARWLTVDSMYRDEDYIFQVDSHTRFSPSWDALLLKDISILPPKSIISHYPLDWDSQNDTLPAAATVHTHIMCGGNWNGEGILQPGGAYFSLKDLQGKPAEGAFVAAGMTFYPREAAKEVPVDPYLKHLFHGEESSISFRWASRGWKFYTPSENVCFHFYMRENFPKFWDQQPPEYATNLKNSLLRVKYLMGDIELDEINEPDVVLKEYEKYGIDYKDPEQAKNMKIYLEKFGIDMKKKTMMDRCNSEGLIHAP